MSDDLYQETILDAYAHPEHFGVLEGADITHQEFNASCGDDVTVFLKVSADRQRLTDMSWQGEGCAISMATTSLLSSFVIGKTLTEINALGKKDLEELVGIHQIAFGREKCLLLGLKAIQHALVLPQFEVK